VETKQITCGLFTRQEEKKKGWWTLGNLVKVKSGSEVFFHRVSAKCVGPGRERHNQWWTKSVRRRKVGTFSNGCKKRLHIGPKGMLPTRRTNYSSIAVCGGGRTNFRTVCSNSRKSRSLDVLTLGTGTPSTK